MTISTLDARTAVLVVDLQKDIVGLPAAHPMADVLANSANLIGAFRRRGLPVVLINVAGGAPGRTERSYAVGELPAGWSDLVPELGQQPGDHIVTKRTWGAFTATDLEKHLRDAGVTQVVIAGVATSAGVESTARQAHELGFNVALAVDAMTDLSLEAHSHSIGAIFPKLGETGTTKELIALVNDS